MRPIRVPYPRNWIPEQFDNSMSMPEAVYKLVKAYNEIADNIWDMSYDEDTRTLKIDEHREEACRYE